MTKQPRLKLPQYLSTVAKYVPHCVECGTTEGVQNAHYSGLYADRLGKGTASKAHDYCVARLCEKHHRELDQYEHSNGDMRSRWFADYIRLTLTELVATGETFVTTPADLRQQKWIKRLKDGLDRQFANSRDANQTINYLATQRDFVEKNGK